MSHIIKTCFRKAFFLKDKETVELNPLKDVPVLYSMGEKEFRLQEEQEEDIEAAEYSDEAWRNMQELQRSRIYRVGAPSGMFVCSSKN